MIICMISLSLLLLLSHTHLEWMFIWESWQLDPMFSLVVIHNVSICCCVSLYFVFLITLSNFFSDRVLKNKLCLIDVIYIKRYSI